jgi:predicted SAM-dependent methyltransferase
LRKLEIGGGTIKRPDYEQLDIIPEEGIDIVCNAACLGIIEDNTYDEIYCKNVIEHFPYGTTVDVLKEWKRVLVPGGRLTCDTPMLMGMVQDCIKGKNTFWEMQVRIYGGQITEYDFHYAGFDAATILKAFKRAGFEDIKIVNETVYSTIIEGRKPLEL